MHIELGVGGMQARRGREGARKDGWWEGSKGRLGAMEGTRREGSDDVRERASGSV